MKMEKKNIKTKWDFIKPTLPKMIVFILLLIFFNPGTIHRGMILVEYTDPNCPPEVCNSTEIYWEYKLPWNFEWGSGNRLIKEIFPFFIPIFYIISCLMIYFISKIKALSKYKT
ncbi:MAG: hypothetical protein V1663_00875 [archaeon]